MARTGMGQKFPPFIKEHNMGSRGGAAGGGGGGGSVEQTEIGEVAFNAEGDFLGSTDELDPTLADIANELVNTLQDRFDAIPPDEFLELTGEPKGLFGQRAAQDFLSTPIDDVDFGDRLVESVLAPMGGSDLADRIANSRWLPSTRVPRSRLGALESSWDDYFTRFDELDASGSGLANLHAPDFMTGSTRILNGLPFPSGATLPPPFNNLIFDFGR